MGCFTSVPVTENEPTTSDNDDDDVLQDISDRRETLAACPDDHLDRGDLAAELGISPATRTTSMDRRNSILVTQDQGPMSDSDQDFMLRAIERLRTTLALRPPGHQTRANICTALERLLNARYQEGGDLVLLDEMIELQREILALQPPDHPGRVHSCDKLGSSLYARYEQCGDLAFLDEVIELERESLALRPPGHPDRAISCSSLGSSHYMRHKRCGDSALLDEAIERKREALDLQPRDYPQRRFGCYDLGVFLSRGYALHDDLTLLDEAIGLKRESLALLPPDDSDEAHICKDLGGALLTRYQRGGDLGLLDEAIELERKALALYPLGDPERAHSCMSLGRSLHARYSRCGDLSLLDEAIKLERESMALCSPGHPDQALILSNLGSSLYVRYMHCGDMDLLDEAIGLQRMARALRLPGHPDQAHICQHLGGALQARYNQCGDLSLLDEAIELQCKSLALRPPGHPAQAPICQNLARALHARYDLCGDLTLLDEAIELMRDAMAFQPRGHLQRASSCANLGVFLTGRYNQCGDITLLDEAIELLREALDLQPRGHPQRAYSCAKLGASLSLRYAHCNSVTLLDEAIELQRESLALQPPDHLERAYSCSNLGGSLLLHYHKCGDLDVLDEAIKLQREAVALLPPGHPQRKVICIQLAHMLIWSYQRNKDLALLDEVIEMSSYASGDTELLHGSAMLSRLHSIPNSPHFSAERALRYLYQGFESQAASTRDRLHTTTVILSQLWPSVRTWTPDTNILVCDAYVKTIDHLLLAVSFTLDNPARLQILAFARHIGSEACLAALIAQQPCKAVELLDRAHGLVWTQALHQRDPQMEGAPPELAAELANLLCAMSVPIPTHLDESPRPAHHEDRRHKENTRIRTILQEIRTMPGLERFMLGSTYENLRKAAGGHPVVVLVTCCGRTLALVISSASEEHPHVLHLGFSSDDLSELRGAVEKAGFRSVADAQDNVPEASIDLRKMRPGTTSANSAASDVLGTLWRKIVEPIITHLQLQKNTGRTRCRLHWCPNGDFVFLPLHAAGIYKGPPADRVCFSDYVVSSYAPTISALLRAQAEATVTSVASSEVKMLLVGEDCRSNPTLGSLWGVQKELKVVESIATQFGHAVETIAKSATVERVSGRIKSANFVHFACHGLQHKKSALESGFHLSDGMLTISKLMDLKIEHPWLAYLSACETAKGDVKQPDQVMHLAAAMLFTGFKHVVATMRVMNDEDGPELAKWFYEGLMSNETIDAEAVAYALDGAVQKLRAKEPSPDRWAQFIHMGA